jgi:hypothetical protein
MIWLASQPSPKLLSFNVKYFSCISFFARLSVTTAPLGISAAEALVMWDTFEEFRFLSDNQLKTIDGKS